jgi:hypothetical protein
MATVKNATRRASRGHKTTKRKTPKHPKGFVPTPILDLAPNWLHDLGSRAASVSCVMVTLSSYPFRAREVSTRGAQLVREMGEKLKQIGADAVRCADEIIEEHQKPAGGAS